MKLLAILATLLAFGCVDDLDPPWELDHDRIVAVRATPPGILSGERSELDALLSIKGFGSFESAPELAAVVAPMSLASALSTEGGRWFVTAPDEARLAAVRTELGLETDAPVPLQVGVSYADGVLVATKTVLLGEAAMNPSVDAATIDDMPMRDKSELVIGLDLETRLSLVTVDTDDVNWLTSCGTMHDFDLPEAYITVEDEDATMGELAVVLRDERTGVAWRVWPIRAE